MDPLNALNTLWFIFQANRWHLKFTKNGEEDAHKACMLYTNWQWKEKPNTNDVAYAVVHNPFLLSVVAQEHNILP